MNEDILVRESEHSTRRAFGIRAEIRLKNSALISARESLGLTVKEASERIGVGYSELSAYENMRHYPGPKTKKRICAYYRRRGVFLLEEDTFPDELRGAKFQRKYITEGKIPPTRLLPISPELAGYLPSPEQDIHTNYKDEALSEAIEEVLRGLSEKQRYVITRTFGLDGEAPENLSEIAKLVGIGRQSVAQIRNAALRKMRHPAKLRILEQHLGQGTIRRRR